MSVEFVIFAMSAVIIAQAGFIIYQDTAHKKNVDKLLDRLMAKSLPELKAAEQIEIVEARPMSDKEEYKIYAKRNGIALKKEEA